MANKLKLVVLGSTGSIGRQTLDIARHYSDRIEVVGLAAHSNASLLIAQAQEFKVRELAMGDLTQSKNPVFSQAPVANSSLGFGPKKVELLAALESADIVLNAMVGAVGLRASYTALKAGKRLALANKESLVVGGDLLMPLASKSQLLPVDSEHSAIYQCFLGENSAEVSKLWITASGGPFMGKTRAQLAKVSPKQALAHPTWQMGLKISIDSSTLMNKGLEIIEAHHLFAIPYTNVRAVVHPQSCIHSLVAFADGSIKAHLGVTNMSIPIQFALSYPERWAASIPAELELTELQDLTFQAPDYQTFGCLRLAIAAGEQGGTMPAVLNAANEVGVANFLAGKLGYLGIEEIVEKTLEQHDRQSVESIEQLEFVDAWARAKALELLQDKQ